MLYVVKIYTLHHSLHALFFQIFREAVNIQNRRFAVDYSRCDRAGILQRVIDIFVQSGPKRDKYLAQTKIDLSKIHFSLRQRRLISLKKDN